MRVITGTAKGKKLKEVPGNTTRPITDRTKEALFSILGNWIIEARMLDLFGGTGAVGIEALSRGPQYKELWEKALTIVDQRPDLLTEDGIAIVQIHPKEFKNLSLTNLSLYDQRKYGSTLLCFYEKGMFHLG